MRHALFAAVCSLTVAPVWAAPSAQERLDHGLRQLENEDYPGALGTLLPLHDESSLETGDRYRLETALGYLFHATGDPERAVLHFRAGRGTGQDSVDRARAALLLAETYLAMQDAEGALGVLGEIPAALSESPEALLLRSTAHSMAGAGDVAEALLERSIAREPSAEALHALAVLLFERGLFEAAEQRLREAATLAKPDYYAVLYRVRALLELGRTEAAREQLRRAAPRTPEVEYLDGLTALRERRYPQAEAAFRRALASQPDYSEALFGLASSLRRQGKAQAARQAYQRFQELEQSLSSYRRRRDSLLEEVKAQPNRAQAYGRVGALALERGDLEMAETNFWRAVRLSPDSGTFRVGLARALRRAGRLQGAVVQYRRALEISPEDVAARRELEEVIQRYARPRRESDGAKR